MYVNSVNMIRFFVMVGQLWDFLCAFLIVEDRFLTPIGLFVNLNGCIGSEPYSAILEHKSIHIHKMVSGTHLYTR